MFMSLNHPISLECNGLKQPETCHRAEVDVAFAEGLPLLEIDVHPILDGCE